MCGIFGLIGREPVAERLFAGAGRLQNRGDRSSSAVTYDESFFYQHGGPAPPLLVFEGFDPDKLPGNMGIVHTRYATTGRNTPEWVTRNMQPVISNRPAMATCNNGDLVNMVSQMCRLQHKGFSFQTEVDAKVIQASLTDWILRNDIHHARGIRQYTKILFESIAQTNRDLNGGYSVLTILDRGIVAFKDPHGIRPLCMAQRKDKKGKVIEVAFASESSVFNYFGDYSSITELAPGQIVFVDKNTLKIHTNKVQRKQENFCFFELIYFARPDSQFKGQYVETVRENLGGVLAEEYLHLKNDIDVVLPLPGTAMSAAQRFAETMNLPIRHGIIKAENKRSFQETSDQKRKKAIDDKFLFMRDFIKDKRVAVVDDSNVRGTTAKKIVKRLYDLGAKKVHLFYFCPPIIGSCFYGIDTPDQTKLVAYKKSNRQINDILGSTSVNYISHEGLIRGLAIPQDELCLACINRKYPTSIDEISQRSRQRKRQRQGFSC